jgi:predicted Rossmann fold flavoprotein
MPADFDVVVVGAGAAGLIAATLSAERGRRVLLLEKNRKPGVKILMSGGTRCNITHSTDAKGIVAAYGAQGRFLHSSLASLSPQDVVELFHAEGVLTKVEETGKVFPVSDRALDVQQALLRRLTRSSAELKLGTGVSAIRQDAAGRFDVICDSDPVAAGGEVILQAYRATKLILTTGGKSYPGCGTTGDGYAWAAQFGHTIIPPRPALVPLVSYAEWVRGLSGVTLPDVTLKISSAAQSKPSVQCRNSLLFTHVGLSGPAALNVSRVIGGPEPAESLRLQCDFLPGQTESVLSDEFAGAARNRGNLSVFVCCTERLPRRLVEALFTLIDLPLSRKCAELSKAERQRLIGALKQQNIPLDGTLGFDKAEVTAGGVALSEVDSRTMQSKLVPNLFFAGEILDLDGPIGGFNFQAAFSTGWLAAHNV